MLLFSMSIIWPLFGHAVRWHRLRWSSRVCENGLWARGSVKDYKHIAKKGFLFSRRLIRNQQPFAFPNAQAVQKTSVKDYKAVFMPHFHGLTQTALFGSFALRSPPAVLHSRCRRGSMSVCFSNTQPFRARHIESPRNSARTPLLARAEGIVQPGRTNLA